MQTETESDQDFQGRESLKLGLFTVYYPEEWKYDKERMQEDDDYSYVRFFDGETADDSGNSIYIEATKEDAYKYRKGLIAFGVDLKEYAEGKAETVSIGNAEYAVMPEKNSGRYTYMYRHEQSGTSYDIRVHGDAASDSVKELLEGIVMELKDEGNKDITEFIYSIEPNTSGFWCTKNNNQTIYTISLYWLTKELLCFVRLYYENKNKNIFPHLQVQTIENVK